ncbi:FAD/NAD(P)-binding domain-containing protein [Hypoxylon sp. FL1284]|nr:FAD/NAD(P)-binding domain-containing protein [Hypoxylon sp. FL1284]
MAPGNRRDWSIAFHWSAPMLASLLGEKKWSQMSRALVDPNDPVKDVELLPLLNGKTGEVLSEIPTPNLNRILRSRLRAFIVEDEIDVQLNKELERISYGDDGKSVTAHFTDGTAETGRLIVGADGSQSRVRQHLVGAEVAKLKKLPIAATFITTTFPADRAVQLRKSVHPIFNTIIHPDNMVGMFTLLDGTHKDRPETWVFSYYISWNSSPEEQAAEAAAGMGVRERLQQGKQKSRAFADPLRSCYDLTPDDHKGVYYLTMGNWDPSLPEHAWDNRGGLVTLLGDAAHPLTYNRGQGLNHTLADSYKLVEILSELDKRPQAELITEYDTEMRARAGEEVRLSEMNTLMLHDWARAKESPIMTRGVAFGSK